MDPDHSELRPNPAAVGRQAEPADPDTAVGPRPPRNARSPRRSEAEILAVISAGGAIGASGRYGASLIWPAVPGTFPWATFWVNVTGSAVLAMLMVLTTEKTTAHPLVRPFLCHGVLGGYTAFSTYAVDAHNLIDDDHVATALLYLASTLAATLFAVRAAAALTRMLVMPRAEWEGGAT